MSPMSARNIEGERGEVVTPHQAWHELTGKAPGDASRRLVESGDPSVTTYLFGDAFVPMVRSTDLVWKMGWGNWGI